MADIKQITEIDLELSKQMAGFEVKLDEGFKVVGVGQTETREGLRDVNAHLKQLNGKVADQERRLSDFEGFKKSVEVSAQEKARMAAGLRSTLISIIVPIIVLAIVWLIFYFSHGTINFQNPT